MRKTKDKTHREPLPFSVIAAATNGDIEAVQTVVQYYEPYITALAIRTAKGKGRPCLYIDEDVRQTLETRLIAGILKFDITRAGGSNGAESNA